MMLLRSIVPPLSGPRGLCRDEPDMADLLPSGLTHELDFIDREAESTLLGLIDVMPWSHALRRRTQHYGYHYDYKRRTFGTNDAVSFPSWATMLADRLRREGWMDQPDQCTVNEYLPGQGISPHIDCVPCYGDTIVALSLGSSCEMTFTSVAAGCGAAIYVNRRSLVVMTGEARYDWRHGIASRKTDLVTGVRVARTRRVSVTFRTIIPSTGQGAAGQRDRW